MKRTLLYTTLFGSVLVCACAAKTEKSGTAGNDTSNDPTEETGETTPPGEEGGETTPPPPPPGGEDPTGNPILLDPPRTIRSFSPPGATPHFVDGPAWSPTKDALFVSLPFAQNAAGGKGILTTFKEDGTNYTELRAGDKKMFGVVGNTVDSSGNVLSAELKAITRTMVGSTMPEIIATGWTYGGVGDPITPFDAPNDLVVLDDGTIYFTDPGYGVDPRPDDGHLFVIEAGAATARLADSYAYNPSPNGIALSKDQTTLYIGFTAPGEGTLPYVRKYTINPDRTLTDAGKFLETPLGSQPDGMAMDDEDNLYIAMKGGIAVYKTGGSQGVPYGGESAKIPQTAIEGEPSGVAFGGVDRKSLFVTTANGKALELHTKVAGLLH